MVDIMEGVDELPSPFIPTVLIERGFGDEVQRALGSIVTVAKASRDGVDIKRPVTTSVVFRCNSERVGRRDACRIGDQVDVRVVQGGQDSAPRWPHFGMFVHKAVVSDVDRRNKMMHVRWLPLPKAEENTSLPELVPLNMSYQEGVPCDSRGGAHIEQVSDPWTCHNEFVIHVPELCAHPRLMPLPPREVQFIECSPKEK